ncbi:unnamed protein product [Rhizophagus irregularis]|nr:unnamed protein product [Rhizophagus irregularis]
MVRNWTWTKSNDQDLKKERTMKPERETKLNDQDLKKRTMYKDQIRTRFGSDSNRIQMDPNQIWIKLNQI